MNEPNAEPQAADVRSFLPRPGEPVDDYAARLRALHHDLTLVLDAVERGLAAAERAPERAEEPIPLAVAPATEPHRSPPPLSPLAAPRGSARVEVISTHATRGSAAGGERAWSGPQEPEGSAPYSGRRAPGGEGAPARGEPAAPSPERFPRREPWVEAPPHPPRSGPWQEPPPWQQPPAWTERRPSEWPPPPPPPAEMAFEPPYGAPPRRRRRPDIPPVLVAATILGWLTAIALVLAIAFQL